MHELSILSEHVDLLAYPLVHTGSESGWTPSLRAMQSQRKALPAAAPPIAIREFYVHRLMYQVAIQDNSTAVHIAIELGRPTQHYTPTPSTFMVK